MAPGARARRGPGRLFDRPAARPGGAGELTRSTRRPRDCSSVRLDTGAAQVDDRLRIVRVTLDRQDAEARTGRARRELYRHLALALGSEGCAAAVHDREVTADYDTGEGDWRGATDVLNCDLAGLAGGTFFDLAHPEIARRDFQPDWNGRGCRSGGWGRRLSCGRRISRSCRSGGSC